MPEDDQEGSTTIVMDRLEITVRNTQGEGNPRLLELSGEVDAYSSTRFRALLFRLIEEGCRDLTLDMSGVRFIDSLGLDALIRAFRHATAQNGSFRIQSPSSAVLDLLTYTRLNRILAVA